LAFRQLLIYDSFTKYPTHNIYAILSGDTTGKESLGVSCHNCQPSLHDISINGKEMHQ